MLQSERGQLAPLAAEDRDITFAGITDRALVLSACASSGTFESTTRARGAGGCSGHRRIASLLGLPYRFALGSSLDAEGHATGLAAGATTSLSGGARAYQQHEMFAAAGVGLRYQNFRHSTYPQHGHAEFVPGLSVVDALMSCGLAGTRALLHGV
jgi:NaMN:DMB phosphoribosyltransferase